MKKQLKKFLALALAVVVLTASGILPTAAVEASEDTYYGIGSDVTEYIAEVAAAYSTVSMEDAKQSLTNSGYIALDTDLNSGITHGTDATTAAYVALGYQTTADSAQAITGLEMFRASTPVESSTRSDDGYTWTKGTLDLNMNGTGNGTIGLAGRYVYLYYTRDTGAGNPLTGLSVSAGTSSDPTVKAGWDTVSWAGTNDAGEPANANKNAGGDYVWVHYTQMVGGQYGCSVECHGFFCCL